MKASELVGLLQDAISKEGDFPVKLAQRYPPTPEGEDEELAGILVVDLKEEGSDIAPKYILLCDNDTFDVSHVGGE